MEELNKNNETLQTSDIAAEQTQSSAPDAENMAAGAAAGLTGPYISKRDSGLFILRSYALRSYACCL